MAWHGLAAMLQLLSSYFSAAAGCGARVRSCQSVEPALFRPGRRACGFVLAHRTQFLTIVFAAATGVAPWPWCAWLWGMVCAAACSSKVRGGRFFSGRRLCFSAPVAGACFGAETHFLRLSTTGVCYLPRCVACCCCSCCCLGLYSAQQRVLSQTAVQCMPRWRLWTLKSSLQSSIVTGALQAASPCRALFLHSKVPAARFAACMKGSRRPFHHH